MPDTETEVILRHEGVQLAHVALPAGSYVIGRKGDAHISIDLPQIAPEHARLTIGEDEIVIEDLGSADGTFVADERITAPTHLGSDQRVFLGDVLLEVRRRDESSAGPRMPPEAQAAIKNFLTRELLAKRRYTIGETVALGGMGAILQALDGPTKRTVAMKVMLGANSERSVLRFIAEAQVTAQLEHPNIVPVHELGVDDRGQIFYTMKMVRGITLKKVLELVADGVAPTIAKYPLSELLIVFQKVCDAVAFAHSKGVLHRDLKPDNVMLDDFGVVLVMDWGLSKVIGKDDSERSGLPARVNSSRDGGADSPPGQSSQTIAGTVLGTPKYMSPEQARGDIRTLDARSDVYSLGAILFQILYLQSPVAGRSSSEILRNVQRGEIVWPGTAKLGGHLPGRRVPASLEAVCRKSLALERDERYSSVRELQADLAAYQAGFATAAEKAGAWTQLRLLVARNRGGVAALGVIVALSLVFAANLLRERNRAESEARRANRALADLQMTAPALRQLADQEARVLRFGPALDGLDAAMALDANQSIDLWRRAHLLVGLERYAEAAAALREAAKFDPGNAPRARINVQLDRMAAARLPEQRYATELVWPVYQQLFENDLTGEALSLSRHLLLQADHRLALAQKQLERAYPPGTVRVAKSTIGRIVVTFINRVSNLDGLRNVACDALSLESSGIRDLEPLRDMRLIELNLVGNPIASLEPLRGMPLDLLQISCANLTDLTPLIGMPLRRLRLEACGAALDLTPLLGCDQLESLIVMGRPENLAVLRRHPALQRISDRSIAEFGGDFEAIPPVAEFWLMRDAKVNAPVQ